MEMPLKIEVSVMQVNSSFRVTIPKEVVTRLSLKKGDIVQFWEENNRIIIEKKK